MKNILRTLYRKDLERTCVIFQLLGYAYFVHWVRLLIGDNYYYIEDHAYKLILSIIIPFTTRWLMTGKIQFKPIKTEKKIEVDGHR
jgi:hypothetical protein